jgi:hypothetical protein
MNVALLFFGCCHLRMSDGWELTRVDASAARSLDGREAASHHDFQRRHRATQETVPTKSNRNLMWLLCMSREFNGVFPLYSYS